MTKMQSDNELSRKQPSLMFTPILDQAIKGEQYGMTKKNAARTFGQVLREKRVAAGFSLRKFASEVGVSPTYLSQVEQDNVDPPTADRVKRMAELLNESIDEWTALAGRLTEDLPEIIRGAPRAFSGIFCAQFEV